MVTKYFYEFMSALKYLNKRSTLETGKRIRRQRKENDKWLDREVNERSDTDVLFYLFSD